MGRICQKEMIRQITKIMADAGYKSNEKKTTLFVQSFVAVIQTELKLYGFIKIESLGEFTARLRTVKGMKIPHAEYGQIERDVEYEEISFAPSYHCKQVLNNKDTVRLPKRLKPKVAPKLNNIITRVESTIKNYDYEKDDIDEKG